MALTLKGITIYLPGGRVKRFTPEEIVAYGTSPTIVVGIKQGSTYTKYAGFPVVFEEEETAIEIARPSLVGA